MNAYSILQVVLCFEVAVELYLLVQQLPLSLELSDNSGTNFRCWVLIGFTSVVNAIPAGENADQYFNHCFFAGVLPSGPKRTHRFPVVTIFSHWFLVLDVRRVFSAAILIKNKLVPVLLHLTH